MHYDSTHIVHSMCSVLPNHPPLSQGSVRAPNPHGDSIRDSANMYAILLANELLSIELRWQEQRDPLELILGVWVEMLLYAANHCSQESHARQLSNGCEFITIVSLLAHHFKYYSGVSRGTEDGGGNSPTGGLDKFASFTPETAPRSSGKTENWLLQWNHHSYL